MLTVWCLWWVDPARPDRYSAYYVQRLQRTVREHLAQPHRFVCITDQAVEGVETLPFPADFPGWWAKIGLFRPGVCGSRNLFLDLDVVVTGGLDELVDHYRHAPLALPSNWAKSGFGGCQSSVMLWRDHAAARRIYDDFDPAMAVWPPRHAPPEILWGDQEFISRQRDQGRIQVEPVRAGWVRSYKYHCTQDHVPEGAKIIVFHGDPKPPSSGAKWLTW